jgi:hypothetical protein
VLRCVYQQRSKQNGLLFWQANLVRYRHFGCIGRRVAWRSLSSVGLMTPTERIQLISELRRSFPAHKRLQEALADYEALAIEANKPAKAVTSRAVYMREHRKREREMIREAREHRNATSQGAKH